MLYICPTPIGNLADITLRTLEVLRSADLIAAEDTRRTIKLLSHYGISKPLLSFYEHNELKRVPELLEKLGRGETIALVSDAGMPGISDPGYHLIKAVMAADLSLEVLPGPSSVETALVSSGLASDSFIFLGYLPRKKGDLTAVLTQISTQARTCIAFETPHRLRATLELASKIPALKQIAICREMTKIFAEVSRGTATQLAASLPEKVKGEIVLVFEGQPAARNGEEISAESLADAVRLLLEAGLSPRQTADIVSTLTDSPRRLAYNLALKIRQDDTRE
ncbi:MAG: 16S rRNA (cytidine(1402)-2'-O)-methyltransferase [Thermoleophilia bacterium]